jgi:60 kDa SS-A/Ro ribonucleoprotein
MSYATHFPPKGLKKTPQSEKASEDQAENNAGGYTFKIDCWQQLDRFLILGAEGGTYYAGERELVYENAGVVSACLDRNAERTVRRIVDISKSGRAPKNDPAVFALAISAAHPLGRPFAYNALPAVCRIGTHLFQFTEAVERFRGWSKGLQKAVSRWYSAKSDRALLTQITKYQQRNGRSHRDMLRLAHGHGVKVPAERQAIYRWVVKTDCGERAVKRKSTGRISHYTAVGELPAYLVAFEELRVATDLKRAIALVNEHGFTHEMVPTEMKNSVEMWEALLERMPVHAMVRNLGKMTEVGLVKPMSVAARTVARKLGDGEGLRKARLHPMSVLLATKQYGAGKGLKGSLMWDPVREVIDALDGAFYETFSGLEPTGKRTLLALDISGSMGGSMIAGTYVSAREASGAMAMVTARSEQNWHAVGFTSGAPGEYKYGAGRSQWGGYGAGLAELKISPRQRLDDITRYVSGLPMGGTDCALPMLYAVDRNLDVDVFVIYTDNETWAGNVHPFQALRAYRQKTGINAKLVVVGMTATEFSIADPTDAGMLDVVGFDTAAPTIIADFARGDTGNHTSSNTEDEASV